MIRRQGRDDAEAFHEAWESGAPSSGEVADLVSAAEALCRAAVVEPRADFRSALREQLMAEAATVLVASPAPAAAPARTVAPVRPHRVRRRIAGIAVAAVSSAGVVGLVAGSAQAVPGDVLYPVKRGVENVELAMHRSEESRGTYRLEIASERLREARAVIADGSPAQVAQLPSLLTDFSENAETGSQQLFDVYGTDGSDGAVESVNDFAAASSLDLTAMSGSLPEDATAAFTDAASIVADLVGQAEELCPSCGDVDTGMLTGALTPSTDGEASSSTPSKDTKPAASSDQPTSEPSAGSGPSVSVPAAPRPTATPRPTSPVATATPEGLGRVTDPLLGGLLGDDEQVGLVPGLVNGLLGGKK